MNDMQSSVLEALDGARNYRRWLVELADPWLGQDVLEVGSGLGQYAAEWLTGDRKLTVTEADPGRLAILQARFAGVPTVTARELALPTAEPGRHSSVVALNVLEHLPDDIAALRSMRGLLAPDGNVVLIVPAFPIAMSRFDREIGHHRRYTRHTLGAALASAGLQVQALRYVNALGLIGWLIVMRGLKGRPRDGLLLRIYDRLVPLMRRAEAAVPPPFGQSLFAVATPG